LPYLGKNYQIAKDSHDSNGHLELRRGKFVFFTNDLSVSNISNMYKRWLLQKSDKLFHTKVVKFSKKLNLSPPKIIIKNLKARWGSVTKEGILILNVNLLKAPNEVIDYIIVHELSHFKIKEHSHHFWELVKMTMPNYENKVNWLAKNATLLIE
jgi:predicted metal-dependent hydrolase